MKEFCALRAKTYLYIMGDNSAVKKSKGTKKMRNKTWNYVLKLYRLFVQR